MKYNKSEIMRNVWSRYKSIPAGRTSFGFCLHLAWVAAKEENEMSKLPVLTGTEKQIEWAEKIRAAQIAWVAKKNACFEKFVDSAREKGREEKAMRYQARIDKNNAALTWLLENATRAGWWLDHSDKYSLYNPDASNFNDWDYLTYCLTEDPEMKNLKFRPGWLNRMH